MLPESLAKYDLPMPPMRFNAKPFGGDSSVLRAGATLTGLQQFSRENLIAQIEAVHGKFDEDVDTERLAFWRAMISNSSIDSYFTRMAKSSLTYYAADLESPTVSFQNSHRHDELGVGRSVRGQLITAGTTPEGLLDSDYFPVVVADFYSHRDLQLGDVSVEQFLLGMKTNIIKDVSIGFKENYGRDAVGAPTQYTCNVCREDYFGWECRHVAGVEYEVPIEGINPNGDPTEDVAVEMVMAVAWIENARLSEVSGVYDGATTNAMIIKAEREVRAGRLPHDTEVYLERRFRFRRSTSKLYAGAEFQQNGETEKTNTGTPEYSKERKTMETEDTKKTPPVDASLPKLRETARNLGLEPKDDATAPDLITTINARAVEYATKAKAYDTLREAAVETAVKARVRKEGATNFDDAAQAKCRRMLGNCESVEDINEFTAEWTTVADEKFGAGRSTTEPDKTQEEQDAADAGDQNPAKRVLPEKTESLLNLVPEHLLA